MYTVTWVKKFLQMHLFSVSYFGVGIFRNFWAQERLEFHPLGSQLNSCSCFAWMAATEDVAVKRRRTEMETQLQQNTPLLFAWIPRNATHEHHQQLCGRHGALAKPFKIPRLKCMLSDTRRFGSDVSLPFMFLRGYLEPELVAYLLKAGNSLHSSTQALHV